MKSERRHELQHNVLADWLANTAETLKPYQNLILAVATVAVIGVAVYTWWSREAASRTAQSWDELSAALESGKPEDLAKVIENHPGTIIADMAALVSADAHLAQGCNALFVNKAEAQNELNKAIESYTLVRQHSHVPALSSGLISAWRGQRKPRATRQISPRRSSFTRKWPARTTALTPPRHVSGWTT